MKQAVFCIKAMVSSKDTQIFFVTLQIEWGIVARASYLYNLLKIHLSRKHSEAIS